MNLPVSFFLFLMFPSIIFGQIYVAHDNYYHHGLFSCFTTVIGLLDHYDKGKCDGVVVDYEDKGLYYEPSKGLNWWNYYFEPINLKRNKSEEEVLSSELHVHFASMTINKIPYPRIAKLVKKYIHVKKSLVKEVDQFVQTNFGRSFVIGVHYRGTDKYGEAPRVSYKTIAKRIKKVLRKYKPTKYVVFLATDEKGIVDFLREQFGKKLVCLNAIRSTNGRATHYDSKENYKKGKEAVMDCLLLSRCQYLIRTSSNLSLCSTFFNPKMPVDLINPGLWDRR